jgi:hypothetical protein
LELFLVQPGRFVEVVVVQSGRLAALSTWSFAQLRWKILFTLPQLFNGSHQKFQHYNLSHSSRSLSLNAFQKNGQTHPENVTYFTKTPL